MSDIIKVYSADGSIHSYDAEDIVRESRDVNAIDQTPIQELDIIKFRKLHFPSYQIGTYNYLKDNVYLSLEDRAEEAVGYWYASKYNIPSPDRTPITYETLIEIIEEKEYVLDIISYLQSYILKHFWFCDRFEPLTSSIWHDIYVNTERQINISFAYWTLVALGIPCIKAMNIAKKEYPNCGKKIGEIDTRYWYRNIQEMI